MGHFLPYKAFALALCSMAAAAQTLEEAPPPDPAGWAKPFDGKSIECVIALPRWAGLDLQRLAQHLDLEAEVFYAETRSRWASDIEDAAAVTEDLADAIDGKPDLIVLANIDLGILPEHVANAIAERVLSGAGLLLVHDGGAFPPAIDRLIDGAEPSDAATVFEGGTGAEAIDDWVDHVSTAESWVAGEGRIVRIRYRGAFPTTHAILPSFQGPGRWLDVYADIYLAYITRAALWTANREPDVRITGLQYLGPEFPEDEEIPPLPEKYVRSMREQSVHQPVRQFAVTLEKPAPKRYNLISRMREIGERAPIVIRPPDLAPPFSKGRTQLPLYVMGGAERMLVDVWLMSRGRVAASWSGMVNQIPRPVIESVAFNRTILRPFDTLEASVQLSFPLHRARPAGLFLRAVTPDGRVAGEGRALIPPQDGVARVQLSVADLDVQRVTVDLYAIERESAEDMESAILFANHRAFSFPVAYDSPRGNFGVYSEWNRPFELNSSAIMDALRGLGADGVLIHDQRGGAFVVGQAGLEPITKIEAAGIRGLQTEVRDAELQGIRRLWAEADLPVLRNLPAATARRLVRVHDVASLVDRDPTQPANVWRLPVDNLANDPEYARWALWYAAMNGFDGVLHPAPYGTTTEPLAAGRALLTPLGLPASAATEIPGTASIIRSGYDRLMYHASPYYSRVAIVDPNDPALRAAWLRMHWESGFVPYVFDPDTADALSTDRFSAVIVPAASLLSDEGARLIARFAAEGGAIVSDFMPALPNANILFGLETGDDGSIAITDAEVRGGEGTRPWYLNRAGAGPTLLLNQPVDPGNEADRDRYAEVLRELGGVSGPRVEIDEDDAPDMDVYAYSLGSARILAAIMRADADGRARISIENDGDEMYFHNALPETATTPSHRDVRIRMEPGDAVIVSAVPYRVGEIQVALADGAIAGRRLHITLRIVPESEDDRPGTHIVYATLTPSFGTPSLVPPVTIQCVEGIGKGVMVLPRNMPNGWYNLVLTDVLTGAETSQRIQVLPPAR